MGKRDKRSTKTMSKQRSKSLIATDEVDSREVTKLYAMQAGMDAHRDGRLTEARGYYLQVLDCDPNDADALHLLGFLHFQSGQFSAARDWLCRAIERRPGNAEFHNNLALAYLALGEVVAARQEALLARRLGHTDSHGYWHVGVELWRKHQLESALVSFELGLLFAPQTAELWNGLGIVHAARKDWGKAESAYRQALHCQADYVEAMNNLGNVFRDQSRISEAVEMYERSIAIAPHFSAAHNNLGVARGRENRWTEAAASFQRAIELDPESKESINNLGNAFRELGNVERAVELYEQAWLHNSAGHEVLCNLALGLRRLGRMEEAISSLRVAVMIKPTASKPLDLLASLLTDHGQTDQAIGYTESLAARFPNQPLWRLRAATCLPAVYADHHSMLEYRERLTHELCNVRDESRAIDLEAIEEIATHAPFNLQFLDGNLRPLKEAYAAAFVEPMKRVFPQHQEPPPRRIFGKSQLGIVVTDGHEAIFLKSLQVTLQHMRIINFGVTVFGSIRGLSAIKSQIARTDIRYVPIPCDLTQAAAIIAREQVRLLFYWEIGTDSLNYFLPFLRLAKVQMTCWGIQVTSGIPNVDVYASSRLIEPDDGSLHYSERLWLLNSLCSWRPRDATSTVANVSRDRWSFPTQAHWYVFAQQLGKVHVDFDLTLAEILRRDPKGILILTRDKSGHQAETLKRRFARSLPDVFDRVHFTPRLDRHEYLNLLRCADAILDAPHFGGVNSSYDALSLNKPVVCFPSEFQRGRYTLGCYRHLGLMQLVPSGAQNYVAMAHQLGTDRDYRLHVESLLAERTPHLFDDPNVHLEYERMFCELLEAAGVP